MHVVHEIPGGVLYEECYPSISSFGPLALKAGVGQQLNLEQLTRQADVVAIGRVTRITETGKQSSKHCCRSETPIPAREPAQVVCTAIR